MKIKIKRNAMFDSIAFFFAAVLIVRPQYFVSAFPNSVFLFTALQVAAIVALSIQMKKVIVNKFIGCLSLFYLYDVVNTYLQNPGQINGAIVAGVWAISAAYIVTFYVKKSGVPNTIKKLSISLTILLWLNFILLILFPGGLLTIVRGTGRQVSIHFLGEVNRLTSFYMLSVVLILCHVFTTQRVNKLYLAVSILVIPISFILNKEKSSTALIGGFILIIGLAVYWFFPRIIKRIILNPIASICIIGVAFFGLTRILTLKTVTDFLVNVLHKDITLSERTTIWAGTYALLLDLKTLVFGLGEVSAGSYITIWTGHTFSAHNLILQLLLLGGIVLLILFTTMVIDVVKNTSKLKNNKHKAIISICLLAFFSINMVEVYAFAIVVLTLYILSLSARYLRTLAK